MGTAARAMVFLTAFAISFIVTPPGPTAFLHAAGGEADRCICPLKDAAAPEGEDPGVFSAAGPLAGDFRLIDVRSGLLTGFLDTARSDYTFVFFLNSCSEESLLSLTSLERLRDRFRGRVGLTVVFLDKTERDEIGRYLDEHILDPDFVLHDPRGTQARCYSFDSPSTLHVIGPRGRIVFTASDKDPVDLAAFTEALDRLLAHEPDYSSFTEARDIYRDAVGWIREDSLQMAALYLQRVLELQPQLYTVNRLLADIYLDLGEPRLAAWHYGRYLAAGYAYDKGEVRENLKQIAAARGFELP